MLMPQSQLNALVATAHQLPEIAKQLKIANMLKAIEIKRVTRAMNFYNNEFLDKIETELNVALQGEIIDLKEE